MRKNTAALSVILFSCGILHAQVNVTTQRNDGFRTSSNLQETVLNPATVSSTTFGKLWSYQVDGDVYAQPLYISNVNVAGVGVRNVVYIVTMHDVVYAFDADRPGTALWQKDLRNPAAGITPYLSANFANPSWVTPMGDAFGILSTPVIDLTSNLLYVVAQTSEPAGLAYRLHAFDIRSGVEPIANTLLQATSQGIVFDPAQHNQRPGLALAGGQIYIAFSGRPDDDQPYHGWMLTYSAATLAQTGAFVLTSAGNGAGIWHGGSAPAVDENGNVYVVSGNGFGGGDGVTNFSESLIKFSFTGGKLGVLDWFTPANFADLDASDYDLGTSGPLVVPGKGITAFGSKTADFYVANNSNLGKLTSTNSGLVQFSHVGTGYTTQFGQSNVMIGLAMWPKTTGQLLYGWPAQDKLFSYTLTGNQFLQTGASTIQAYGGPGAGMSLSANGSTTGSGILWASMALNTGGYVVPRPGVLRAFNAENLTTELWDSNMNSAQDGITSVAKFNVPTVANGHVYVATFDGLVHVYGLLASKDFALAANPSSITVSQGTSGTSAITATANGGFTGTVTYSASGAPAGVTVGFAPTTTTGTGQTIVTVAVASTVAGGVTYPVVITGTSGTLSHTTILSLTIPAHSAPTISITSPANNATFTVGANITVSAQPTATGATVASVAFLQGTTTLGTDTASPYNFTANNVPAGTYSLTAKVTDSLGSTATSSPITIVVAPAAPPVSLTVAPTTISLMANQTQQFTPTVTNATNKNVTWSVSPTVGSVSAAGLYTAPASIASVQTVTVTAISAADATKTAAAIITLIPAPVSVTPVNVNLASVYNVRGIVNNGTFPSNGGFDADSYAYSSALIGTSITWSGVKFPLGPVGANDAVSNLTIALPAGQYASVKLLGAGVNGNQTGQTFVVTYTDGTTSTFAQSMSDWASPQNYAGESTAATMAYRVAPFGTTQSGPWYVYGYSFALNGAKSVKSITLPARRNVVMLAIALTPNAVAAPAPVAVNMAGAFNLYGIVNNGGTVLNGGVNGVGQAYSANLLGTSLNALGVPFVFGAPGTLNAATTTTVPLPAGSFSSLKFLGAGVNGSWPSQNFVVTYTDGTSTTFTQSLSRWLTPQNYPGETIAATMPYRLFANGSQEAVTVDVFAYSFALNNAKTPKSITLPSNLNVVVLAITLQ